MMRALLLTAALLQAPSQAPAVPPPPAATTVPIEEHLQVWSDLEALKLERARLLRRIAELEGLTQYLGSAEVQGLAAGRAALDEALRAAGFELDAKTGVVRKAAPGGDAK